LGLKSAVLSDSNGLLLVSFLQTGHHGPVGGGLASRHKPGQNTTNTASITISGNTLRTEGWLITVLKVSDKPSVLPRAQASTA
jgi:hypothetical protein